MKKSKLKIWQNHRLFKMSCVKDPKSSFDKTPICHEENAVNIFTYLDFSKVFETGSQRKFLGLETINTRTGTWLNNCLKRRWQAVSKWEALDQMDIVVEFLEDQTWTNFMQCFHYDFGTETQKWSNKTWQHRVGSHCRCGERWGCHGERIGWPFVRETEMGENSVLWKVRTFIWAALKLSAGGVGCWMLESNKEKKTAC